MASSTSRSSQRRLGARIRALRDDRNLTQEQLATRCGLSQKYLSELERGQKAPSWDTLVAVAHRGFQIRIATLVYQIDEDTAAEARQLDEVLAGRSEAARYDILRALELVLRAGEKS